MTDDKKGTLDDLLNDAERTGEVDLGERVFCDYCGTEWTGRPETGGFLFGSKAVCPTCAPAAMKRIEHYNEQHYIKARCPAGQSYWKWTLSLRGGDNKVRIYKL